MTSKFAQMLRRAQTYSAVGPAQQVRSDGDPQVDNPVPSDAIALTDQWYWTAASYLSSWLLAGGLLMLPTTFDVSDGYKVSKTGIAVFAIALITCGLCFTVLLMMAIRSWTFRSRTLLLPAFSSCLLGCLTIWYSFIIQERYKWNLPGILSALFASLLTLFYGLFVFFSHRCVMLDRIKPMQLQQPRHSQHPSYTQTQYEGFQLADPSTRDLSLMHNDGHESQIPKVYSQQNTNELLPEQVGLHYDDPAISLYEQPRFALARSPSNAVSSIGPASILPFPRFHDSTHTLSERPSAATLDPRPSMASMRSLAPECPQLTELSEEELMRQQMLMLLTTRPQETPRPGTGRERSESTFKIEWKPGDEDEEYSPAAELSAHEGGFSFEPNTKEARDKLLIAASAAAANSAGELPPGYFERKWDGVWREPSALPVGVQHPVYRESRFLKTGGASREERRREIERRGTRSQRGSA